MKRDAKFVGRTASVGLPQLQFVVGLFAGPVSERVRFAVARPIRFLVLVAHHSKKDAAIVPPSHLTADPARRSRPRGFFFLLFLHARIAAPEAVWGWEGFAKEVGGGPVPWARRCGANRVAGRAALSRLRFGSEDVTAAVVGDPRGWTVGRIGNVTQGDEKKGNSEHQLV